MSVTRKNKLSPLANSGAPKPPGDSDPQAHPLRESLHNHFQQLHVLESAVRDAQRQIDGLRQEIQDVIRRGEDLLRQVASNSDSKRHR